MVGDEINVYDDIRFIISDDRDDDYDGGIELN